MDSNDIVFDLTKALEQVGGDREVLKEIIDIYCQEYPKQLQQIQEAIDKKNAVMAGNVAHTIKGAVANFGAKPSFGAALNLEKIGKSGDLSHAKEAFDVLKKELERLDRELNKT